MNQLPDEKFRPELTGGFNADSLILSDIEYRAQRASQPLSNEEIDSFNALEPLAHSVVEELGIAGVETALVKIICSHVPQDIGGQKSLWCRTCNEFYPCNTLRAIDDSKEFWHDLVRRSPLF